jgi:hypothetical protein
MLYWLGADSIKEVSVGKRFKRKGDMFYDWRRKFYFVLSGMR